MEQFTAKVNITIEFTGDNEAEVRREIANLIRSAAHHVVNGHEEHKIADLNGNTVGKVTATVEKYIQKT